MSNLSSVRVAVEFHWRPLGRLKQDENGRLLFPSAPRQPGLYRFRLLGSDDIHHYIGETDELRRRFQHYRTPGPSQKTNIRMNEEFHRHFAAGGTIGVDIATDGISVSSAGATLNVDLADKAMRRLLEYATLVSEAGAGVKLLNR